MMNLGKPACSGDRADELARAEHGESFLGVNRSGMPACSDLEVDLTSVDGETTLLPSLVPSLPAETLSRSPALELRHGERDLVLSQLLDDPASTTFTVPGVGEIRSSASRMQRAISRNQNREELVWFGIDRHHLSAALADRIIVRRDTLESEYVCRSCHGKGHHHESCPACDGRARRGAVACTACLVSGFEQENRTPGGFRPCGDCNGTGWRNGVIIPEIAQTKPVTGIVVSLGPNTAMVKLGDRVLHSRFAGHTLELKAESYTYMRESEVISLLREI